jgi:transposase
MVASYEEQVWDGFVQKNQNFQCLPKGCSCERGKGGSEVAVLNVGIDLGVTSKHKAVIINESDGEICGSISFMGTKAGFDELSKYALRGAPKDTNLRFICEATGMSWFPLAIYGKQHNCQVVRVKNQRSHDLRKYYSKHKKNDSLDAKVLANLPRIDRDCLQEVYLPDKVTYALDRRCRQREKITKEISAIKSRLKSLYHWLMPGLMSSFEDSYGSRAKAFYGSYSNPFKVESLGPEKLTEFLSEAGRQRMSEDLPRKVYNAAIEGCKLYRNATEKIDFQELQEEIECELELLKSQEKVIHKVEAAIKKLYNEVHSSKNIETIPGIGETLGPVFIGIIGDPTRFTSESKARGYSGMIPKQNESGESSKKGLNITKDGPSRYRRSLYLAADISRQWDPQLAEIYYSQMVEKGNCHTQAVCSVATHLIGRIFAVLKEDKSYDLQDVEGESISKKEAKALIKKEFVVPEHIRQRTRSRKKQKRKKGYHDYQKRGLANLQPSRIAQYPQ